MDAQVNKILSELRSGRFHPVYFLQGEESFFIDQIDSYIEDHALKKDERAFNQVVLYGRDIQMPALLTHARRFPMMAERQVVIVREAQEISDLNKESGMKLLLDYLNNPVPSTVLVFCHKHKSLDKRKELGKKIDKLSCCLNAKKIYDSQLPDFVKDYALHRNISLDNQAAQMVADLVGNDLNRVANELDKLFISLSPGEVLTTDRILQQVGISKDYNIFELQKAIVKRDGVQARQIVVNFSQNTRKNPVIPLVAFLFSFFSKLLMAASLSDKSEKGLATALKLSPYAIKDYTIALRKYSLPEITENISLLRKADLKLKGVDVATVNDAAILEELVWRIIH